MAADFVVALLHGSKPGSKRISPRGVNNGFEPWCAETDDSSPLPGNMLLGTERGRVSQRGA